MNLTTLPLEAVRAKLLLVCGFLPIVLLLSAGAVGISSLFEKAQCSMACSNKMCIMILWESLEGGSVRSRGLNLELLARTAVHSSRS